MLRTSRFSWATAPRRALPVLALGCLATCAAPHLCAQLASSDLTVAQKQADLEAFRTQFLAIDQSYSDAARAQAEQRLAELEKELGRVTRAQFELQLAQIVALADNGHTASFAGPRSRRYDRVPIRLAPFGDQFHVLRAKAQHRDLLGARLVAIDGVAMADVVAAARTLAGGVDAWRDRNASYLIESPQQLHALGVIDREGVATYQLELVGGERVERELEAEPASADRLRANANRWLYPELDPAEGPEWRALLEVGRAPWSLRDIGQPFRARDAPALDATVVELRQNNSSPGHRIGAGLARLRTAIRDGARQHLVLDMRMNGGGDLNTTRGFMQSLPRLVPGRIFVLMSPWTFSAAISSIGYLEQEAPERVTLVGEGPGDRLEFFAEGSVVRLPHSGASLLYATERHDYRTGCKDKPDCHRSVAVHPIAVPTLAPDVPAPWTIEDYVAGRDPALEAVRRELQAGRR